MDFGKKVRKLRKDRGLKQVDLAKVLGCSVDHIQSIESGRRKPSVDLLEKIAEATNTMLVVIFFEE
jgi:transcriptional regulator with XRE-family HTH domain